MSKKYKATCVKADLLIQNTLPLRGTFGPSVGILWVIMLDSSSLKGLLSTKLPNLRGGTTKGWKLNKTEPQHDKTNKITCVPRRESDQPWASAQSDQSSLSVCRNFGSLSTHWLHSELWSNCTEAQADLSLRWVHMSFCWFCGAAAQIKVLKHKPCQH